MWYRNYDSYKAEAEELREKLFKRCNELGVKPAQVLGELSRDVIVKAVHESNWQEGLQLGEGDTQEMADLAFGGLSDVAGPHLDMRKLLILHRESVMELKKTGSSIEKIAAFNLARAHHAIVYVIAELAARELVCVGKIFEELRPMLPDIRAAMKDKVTEMAKIENAFATIEQIKNEGMPITFPMTKEAESPAALVQELLRLDYDALLHPMRVSYLHFFHRLALMEIKPRAMCGRFRKKSVQINGSYTFFPPPSVVPGLMTEFCLNFPWASMADHRDPIMTAAKISHRFVQIHPYEDGNGRVSRLLMNMILWGKYPPIYLKADGKGRRRYMYALRRADRGDINALASLIAMSLVEILKKSLAAF